MEGHEFQAQCATVVNLLALPNAKSLHAILPICSEVQKTREMVLELEDY